MSCRSFEALKVHSIHASGFEMHKLFSCDSKGIAIGNYFFSHKQLGPQMSTCMQYTRIFVLTSYCAFTVHSYWCP